MRSHGQDQDVLATWLVADTKSHASFFPQAGLDSSSAGFQDIYWRCVVCFFASSRRVGNRARHLFYTNVERIPHVDGFDVAGALARLDVEVRVLPIKSRLGVEKVSAWNNQFYILDIIEDLFRSSDCENVAVFDSDCVWVRPADELLADVSQRGILSLCIPYALDHRVNGASRREMRQAAEQLTGRPLRRAPYYSGGELFAARFDYLQKVHAVAQQMWAQLQAAPPGELAIYEEGHLLSIIYELMEIPVGTADPHIRRMWTALRLYNVTWEDVDSSRCVWHLPTEKKTGFADLFAAVRDEGSWFWTSRPEDMRLRIAATMGIPSRSSTQWARKVASRMADHWRSRSKRLMNALPAHRLVGLKPSGRPPT